MSVTLWLLLIVPVVALVALGWYLSNLFLVPEPYSLMPEFTILEVGEGSVTLPLPAQRQFADTRLQGVYNLLYEGGYGRLGEVFRETSQSLTRVFTLSHGEPPKSGAPARLDYVIYRSDPLEAHGLPFEDLTLQGQVGKLKAWWLPNEGNTAVLMLHGKRRADRTETLRIMPTLVNLGYPVLALAYRNHDTSDPSPDGLFHFGASEWQDAMTALDFLRAQGIRRVVIYGFSMGGAVTLETAERLRGESASAAQTELVAVILDAPLLDPKTVFRHNASALGLPNALINPLTDLAMWVATKRSGVDWKTLNQQDTIHQVTVPVLLIHGSQDSTVPVALSDALVERTGGSLTYHRVEGAEHIEAWNQDPEAYEGWVQEFLACYAPLVTVPAQRPAPLLADAALPARR